MEFCVITLPLWFYLSLGGSVLAVFFIFLSGAISQKAIGALLMFSFTLLGGAILWYGLESAEKQSRYNLGRPDPVFSQGSYHIIWGTFDTVAKKVYLISSGKDEDPGQGVHMFVVDPDDKFLQKVLRELQKKKPFMMVVGQETRAGTLQNSFEFHPEPPPASVPKN